MNRRWIAIGLVAFAGFFLSVWAQERGVIVKVKMKNGQEIELYKNSYALLIGESKYTKGWPQLESIPGELNAVERSLQKQGFVVEKKENAGSEELKRIFEDFINRYGFEKDNRLLIFFSGHGHTRKDGAKGYIVPIDAPNPNDDDIGFVRKAIEMEQIVTWAKRIESKHVLFLFDSCFSGMVFKAKDLPVPKYISAATANPVRQFISGGSANETLPARSIFTPSFVRGIDGEADTDGDGYITGTELGSYLYKKVLSYNTSDFKETPQYGKIKDPDYDEGDFVFKLATSNPEVGNASNYKPNLPSAAVDIDLGNLEAEAGKTRQAKENEKSTWAEWQTKMSSNVEKVKVVDQNPDIAGVSKKATWEKLLNIYNENNPYSAEDENLRKYCQERITYWENYREPVVVTSAGKTSSYSDFGIEMVSILSGTFQMGSDAGDADEKPVHTVTVRSFYLGKTEVTQGQWQSVMGSNPSNFQKGDNYPVENVSWDNCQSFIQKLNQITGKHYRLPTEAEWEYACRAGTAVDHYGKVDAIAWNNNNSGNSTHPVGRKKANSFGLYDMSGNVWELCSDWYGGYTGSSQDNPMGPNSGSNRVVRGGSWYADAWGVRSANRGWDLPGTRNDYLGFRLASDSGG